MVTVHGLSHVQNCNFVKFEENEANNVYDFQYFFPKIKNFFIPYTKSMVLSVIPSINCL